MCSFAVEHNEFHFIEDDFHRAGVSRYRSVIWPVATKPPIDRAILHEDRADHPYMQAGSFTW